MNRTEARRNNFMKAIQLLVLGIIAVYFFIVAGSLPGSFETILLKSIILFLAVFCGLGGLVNLAFVVNPKFLDPRRSK
jgi:peptidoglycan/LPS O-acetylase OafA/YrhL